jgi:aerobic-type carbon monoxide dehydrogenase small subunit (CoxS/CutS family)
MPVGVVPAPPPGEAERTALDVGPFKPALPAPHHRHGVLDVTRTAGEQLVDQEILRRGERDFLASQRNQNGVLDGLPRSTPFAPRPAAAPFNTPRSREPPMPVTFTLNGRSTTVEDSPDTPLLWVLRDTLGLTGTKFGCGISQCGACTVLLDGEAVRTCQLPIGSVEGKRVTSIEGLSADGSHPVQRAWIAEDVPQCGYCQSGQIMAAVALLAKTPNPTDDDINAAMTNICRCGTYQRIRAAIHRAAREG